MKYQKVEDYIYVTKTIPENICKKVLEKNESKKWTPHKWYNAKSKTFYSAETKELDVLGSDEESQKILNPYMSKALGEYVEKYSYFQEDPIVYRFSPIRFNRYQSDQIMRPHYDHIYSLFDGREKGIPSISIIGNLNEDYEGGELVFWGEKKYKLGTGEFCIFPSNFMYTHEVYEVTKGERHSFVSWAW